ncbi:MAG: hypothetical protein QI223_09245 [Candidatus Korarchaeota archaeon]|nr:hypothetical protein [Candidatus Korarchaeota archaeon]
MPGGGESLTLVDWDELRSSRDRVALREALKAALWARARERERIRGSRRVLEDVKRLRDLARLVLEEMGERGEISFRLDERGSIEAVYIGSGPAERDRR